MGSVFQNLCCLSFPASEQMFSCWRGFHFTPPGRIISLWIWAWVWGAPNTAPPYTFLCTHHSFRGFSQSSESSFLPNWGVGYPLLRRSVVLCRDHSNFTTRTVCPREGRPCGHRVLPVRGCSETGSSSWACRWPLPGSAASFVEDHSVRSWPHARQASCGNVVVWHFF